MSLYYPREIMSASNRIGAYVLSHCCCFIESQVERAALSVCCFMR